MLKKSAARWVTIAAVSGMVFCGLAYCDEGSPITVGGASVNTSGVYGNARMTPQAAYNAGKALQAMQTQSANGHKAATPAPAKSSTSHWYNPFSW
jgi:hypothetical protein